jgi:hypothetical protein
MRYLLILFLLAGCAGTKPYLEIGLGSQINRNTDYWVQTPRDWQCSKNIQVHIEPGLEWDSNWRLGYHHKSWLLCGGPFNNHPEVYADDIRLTKKFGGK